MRCCNSRSHAISVFMSLAPLSCVSPSRLPLDSPAHIAPPLAEDDGGSALVCAAPSTSTARSGGTTPPSTTPPSPLPRSVSATTHSAGMGGCAASRSPSSSSSPQSASCSLSRLAPSVCACASRSPRALDLSHCVPSRAPCAQWSTRSRECELPSSAACRPRKGLPQASMPGSTHHPG